MNQNLSITINSNSVNDTLKIAQKLGEKLRGGEIIDLVSDIGGGKTTFVRGLVQGIGVLDLVSSPSFTINNEYHSSQLIIYHYDFYRLDDPGIIADEIVENIKDKQAVVIIEWSDIIKNILPIERLTIEIIAISETERKLILSYPLSLQYLID